MLDPGLFQYSYDIYITKTIFEYLFLLSKESIETTSRFIFYTQATHKINALSPNTFDSRQTELQERGFLLPLNYGQS